MAKVYLKGVLPLTWLFLLGPSLSLADGGFFGKGGALEKAVTSAAQKAILIQDGEDHEILILQTTYHGPADEFAWVIPVPGLPRGEDVFPASSKFIDGILALTAPWVTTEIYDPRHRPPRDPFWNSQTGGIMGGEHM